MFCFKIKFAIAHNLINCFINIIGAFAFFNIVLICCKYIFCAQKLDQCHKYTVKHCKPDKHF